MDAADDPCAARAGEVHAEVHAVWFVVGAEGGFDALGEAHHFGESFGIGAGEVADVGVRNDHDVAGRVGEAVEDDENFFAAVDDEVFFIVGAGGGVAENAFGDVVGLGLFHVLVAPWSPDVVHLRSRAFRVSQVRLILGIKDNVNDWGVGGERVGWRWRN